MLTDFFSPSDVPRRPTLGRMVSQSTVLLMASIGSLILLLSFLILIHENANATKGYRLRSLERARSLLLLEQEVLSMQIAEAQALEKLKQDQTIQAMIPLRNPRYTEGDTAVAQKRD